MNNIILEIEKLRKAGIDNIMVIALITDTSREVIFYGDVDGIRAQSNNLVEEGKISIDVVDNFYETVTKIVRESIEFMPDKMNIIKADSKKVDVSYCEKRCRTYKIIKEWEEGVK